MSARNNASRPAVGRRKKAPVTSLRDEIEANITRIPSGRRAVENAGRNAELFRLRYSDGLSLKAAGDRYGLTRERVRQLVDGMKRSLQGVELATTRYQELAAACASKQAMPLSLAESILAPLLGGVSIPAAAAYGEEVLGIALPATVDTASELTMFVPDGHSNWLPAAAVEMRRMIRSGGALMPAQAWTAAQSNYTHRLDLETVLSTVQMLPGFAWLDEQRSWFWFGPEDGQNRLLHQARRVLEAAGRPVDIEHVHAGVARHPRRIDAAIMADPLPPPGILLAMLASCADVCVSHGNDVGLAESAAVEPGDDLDSRIIACIEANGGAARFQTLVDALVKEEGVLDVSLRARLTYSPVVRRLLPGIYVVRGREVDPEAIVRAARMGKGYGTPAVRDGAGIGWDVTITAGKAASQDVHVPVAVLRELPPGLYRSATGTDVAIPEAASHVRLRLSALTSAPIAIGARFRVRFDRRSATLTADPLPAKPTRRASDGGKSAAKRARRPR